MRELLKRVRRKTEPASCILVAATMTQVSSKKPSMAGTTIMRQASTEHSRKNGSPCSLTKGRIQRCTEAGQHVRLRHSVLKGTMFSHQASGPSALANKVGLHGNADDQAAAARGATMISC